MGLKFNTVHRAPAALVLALSAMLLAGCSKENTANIERAVEKIEEKAAGLVPDNSNGRNKSLAGMGKPKPYSGNLATLAEINIRDAQMERVLKPMDYAYAFEFIGEQEILLTLHGGTLLRVDLASGERTEITGLPVIGSGFTQIGLMDIALHPNFKDNQRIYFSYARPNPAAPTYHYTEVATAVIDDNQLTQLTTLINPEYYGWAPSNFGGALEFDAEGRLFISMGDRGEDPLLQRGDKTQGKILRLNDDGSVPEDNPFVGMEGYDPRIYAIGVRNPQGLYFDKVSGLLLEVEHGPMGGDEVNIIRSGSNYGHPVISYGNNYSSGRRIGEGTHKEGMVQPIYYFLPSIAASKLMVYRGEMFSEWDGHIFVTALRGEHVAKLDLDGEVVRSHRAILSEVGGRIRDIKTGPDGSIYILSQTGGLHRLFRPPPAPPATPGSAAPAASTPPEDAPHPGRKYYEIVCSGCHDSGAMEAPKLGDYAAWKPIMEQPLELTRDRVLNGYNNMPERGLCHVCGDAGIMQMVDYMFVKAQENAP